MGLLTGKTAIVGVGETTYYRDAKRTTYSLGIEAIKRAVMDAGLKLTDIDAMTSYQGNDSHSSNDMAQALGMRLNYSLDIMGGGSSTEALVAHAAGLLAGGYCNAMVIFRSMRGRTGRRPGGQAPTGPAPPMTVVGHAAGLLAGGYCNAMVIFRSMRGRTGRRPGGQAPTGPAPPMTVVGHAENQYIGVTTPAQMFGLAAMRYMHDFGMTTRQLGAVAMTHRYHATLNPKAFFYKRPLTMEDYLQARWVSKPFRLFDCCLEMDVSCALVMTRAERSYDLKHPPVFVMGGTARTMAESPGYNPGRRDTAVYHHASNWGRNRVFAMSGRSREDVDLASFYDAFTITPLLQLEGYGFVGPGEAGFWYEEGRGRLDAELPVNTSGSHLSEGYSHGIQMVIEMTRQLRGRADDACPDWERGIHSYDREEGCRQVRRHENGFCAGWGSPVTSSSLMLSRHPN